MKRISTQLVSDVEYTRRPFALRNHEHKNYLVKDDPVLQEISGDVIFTGTIYGIDSNPITVVPDITSRDSIIASKRYDGMMVYIVSSKETYQLQGGINNINWSLFETSVPWGQLTGDIANQADLQFELSTKSDIGHTHNLSALFNDVGFITDYTVTETDVTIHQNALAISQSQVINLTQDIEAKEDLLGNPPQNNYVLASQVDGTRSWVPPGGAISWGDLSGTLSDQADLQGELDLKASISHTHTIVDISGLQTALDGKVDDSQVLTDVPLNAVFTDTTDHASLSNIGVNTHTQIDAHLNDATIHFTMGSISITESQINDFGSYALSNHSHNLSTLNNDVGYITDYVVTEIDVTSHQAALTISESQVTNLSADLTSKEPSLNNPATDGYVLSSTASGIRSWIPNSSGGSALTVQDEGVSLSTGAVKINFAGAGVTASEPAANEILVTIPGGGTGAATYEKSLSQPGTLQAFIGNLRWYPSKNITLSSITASVGTAPSGTAINVDVNLNGVSIVSNGFDIPAGANISGTQIPTTTVLTPTDYVTIDINQVGSTTAGDDLVVTFKYTET